MKRRNFWSVFFCCLETADLQGYRGYFMAIWLLICELCYLFYEGFDADDHFKVHWIWFAHFSAFKFLQVFGFCFIAIFGMSADFSNFASNDMGPVVP